MRAKPSIYLRWQGYYDYNQKNVKRYVLEEPRLAGVYKIAELQTFGRLVPFYVGETDDLYKVLMIHSTQKEKNECLKKRLEEKICCFKFAPLLEQELRKAVLYTLYEHYRPCCNEAKKMPKATLINVNFQ